MSRNTRSMARLCPGPVLLAREMCEVCHGDGKVPTPEMAGWRATVERLGLDIEAANPLPSAAATYERAREQAREQVGPPPEPTVAECKGCEGRGCKETELTVGDLAKHLAAHSEGAE